MTDGTTHFTRPDVAAFLAFLNAQEGPKMEEMPPEGARAMFRMMGQLADVPRGEIAHVENRTIPGPAGEIVIRIYDTETKRLVRRFQGHDNRITDIVCVFSLHNDLLIF